MEEPGKTFLSAWKRPSKKLNNVCNTLRTHGPVASRTAKSHEETDMTSNAITDCAEARQVDEKAFLENGGKRVVEVGSFCEAPQFFSDPEFRVRA